MIAALKDAGEVVSEVLMCRQGHRGAFLLLEGPDDSRFWEPRVHQTQCEIVIAGGKKTVVSAIRDLDRLAINGTVGLVDDDCDRQRSLSLPSPNLIATDARDLEGVLLRSTAFAKVLAEYGDRAKIAAFESKGVCVKQALLDRALLLGRLRWLALVKDWNIKFSRLRHLDFVDAQSWQLDESALVEQVQRLGNLPERSAIEHELSKLTCPDPWLVCHGHDLIAILGIGLSHVLGKHNPGANSMGAVLRAGFTPDEFAALSLTRDLRGWEATNPPFVVLPNDRV